MEVTVKTQCIQDLFEVRAEEAPDRSAAVFEGRSLSYGELNRKANRVARELRTLGVGPEVLAAICVERSAEMVAGLLGILKAGGAYLPLDPSYPTERLEFMLSDSQAPVLVTEQRLAKTLPRHNQRVLLLDKLLEQDAGEPCGNPPRTSGPNNLAYVIYTSGSTGKPKGVQVEHRSVLNILSSLGREPGLTGRDVLLAVTTISFDMSVAEIFLPLSAGAQVVIAGSETAGDGHLLSKLLAESGATVMQATPAGWRLLLDSGWQGTRGLKVLCGGEALSRDLAGRLLERSDSVWNLYGPTETTIYSAGCRVEPGEGAVPIGLPVSNTRIYVLGSDRKPVPPGGQGELYIGGEGLARGYLRHPELTEERFVEVCVDGNRTERLYRTGDLGRLREDGYFEYAGRTDRQVKLRGFRIELGEIESVLEQHPLVKECAVEMCADRSGDKYLAAYIVVAGTGREARDKLRGFLAGRLPSYMVPSAFLFLERMPRLPNGKVDRNGLPKTARERQERESGYVAPRNRTEEEVARIWAEALGLERVGIHDNFLSLGGHSLRAAQVISRLREGFGVRLGLRHLFDAPTVAEMGRLIESSPLPAQPPPARISSTPRTENTPVSCSQERIWFIQQLEPANQAYTFQASLTFTGPLDAAALERSLQEIVRRHEIYRTTFFPVDGRPAQRIHAPWPVRLAAADLSRLPEQDRRQEAERLANEHIQQPYDLSLLPLVRWLLLRMDAHKHVLLHSEHHMVHDGWSFLVFVKELLDLYRAFSSGRPSPLSEPAAQFADFVLREREWTLGEAARKQIEYWTNALKDSPPPVEFLPDRSRPPVQTYRGSIHRFEIPLEASRAIREACRREGVTLFMMMLAAFHVLVHRYTGQEDLSIGSGVANRRWPGAEGLIGMLVNNVVLRTDLSGHPSFREVLRRVRKVVLEANENQELAFDRVVAALRPLRDPSRNPLYQMMFNFHDTPLAAIELPDLKVDLHEVICNGTAKFDVNVIAIPGTGERSRLGTASHPDGITIIWEYNTDLFDTATMERMAGHYLALLAAAVSNPDTPVSGLPMMTDEERRRVLVEWNDTRTDFPASCVHELFEEQAARTPDQAAVIHEEETLTYSQLNRMANRVAGELRRLGVGPDVLVGICSGRSPRLIAAMLGVLKAGGAYVPLDPEYPKERLELMLKDSGAPVLLTEKRMMDRLPELSAHVVCLDAICESGGDAEENPRGGASPASLAYAMYTSGSTGTPKAALIPHQAVVRLLCNTDYIQLDAGDRIAFCSNSSFDAATFEIWGALLHGGSVVVFDRNTLLSPERFAQELRGRGITTLFLTTALFNQMAAAEPGAFRCLRNLLVGGEKAVPESFRNVLKHGPPGRLLHVYGPTETTTFASWFAVTEAPSGRAPLPIGRPIANTQIYVLDRMLQPVPAGVAGELHIGGPGLARGYLNRPKLTAEKFIANPLSGTPAPILYRTGDLARYRPDGNIEFLGRLDDQVKVRGFRVEPGEVEAALASHPAVRQAVVVLREDVPGDKRLTGYVTTRDGPRPSPEELRNFACRVLPQYMVPAGIVILDEAPLTPNGKIDKAALPAPGAAAPASGPPEIGQPRTPEERILTQIWRTVLGCGEIGIFDNFFDLGGDSIHVMRISAKAAKEGLRVAPAELLEHQTIAELASKMSGRVRGHSAREASGKGGVS